MRPVLAIAALLILSSGCTLQVKIGGGAHVTPSDAVKTTPTIPDDAPKCEWGESWSERNQVCVPDEPINEADPMNHFPACDWNDLPCLDKV